MASLESEGKELMRKLKYSPRELGSLEKVQLNRWGFIEVTKKGLKPSKKAYHTFDVLRI